ncbi:MAG: flagellin [Verrucomicrobia bacterium]|nr:flagellin [Verrucomicrobiota bacterium]
MSVIINTNYAATVASNNLATSSNMLQRSLNRLSSGSKIVNPSDDAGGLAVSMKLSATAKRQGAVANNLGNAVSYLQTQDGGLKVASKVMERMSELKTLFGDVTKSDTDKANYDTEFNALQTQLTAISRETFNGIALFGTSLSVVTTEDGSSTSALSLNNRDLASSSAGVGVITAASTSGLADVTLGDITTAIETIANMRASNGAELSRLAFASEMLTINKANLESATSRIIDVDVAEESTQLARWNTLVQAGTSMLSQANQSAQTALKLLQG